MFLFIPAHDEKPKLRNFSERQKFKRIKKIIGKRLKKIVLALETKQLEINFSNSRKLFYG